MNIFLNEDKNENIKFDEKTGIFKAAGTRETPTITLDT
jgi:hypothetical protein